MKVTKENYFSEIEAIGVNNLPEEMQVSHLFFADSTRNGTNWNAYKKDQDVKETIDEHLETFNIWLEKEYSKAKQATKKKVPAKPAKAETKSVNKKEAVKKEKKAIAKSNKFQKPKVKIKFVKTIREEVKFIKQMVGLHQKKKSLNSILLFIKRLQKSIDQLLIRKTSPLANEIEYIQKWLIKKYNGAKGQEVYCEIEDEKTLVRMAMIAGGEALYKSIGLMRRFVGMEGKTIERKKIDTLINSMKNVTSEDPFLNRVKKMIKALAEAKASGGKVKIASSELGGLNGILGCCDKQCKELGMIYDTRGNKVRRCSSKKYSDAGNGACSYNGGLEQHNLGKIYNTNGKKLRRCTSKKYSDAKAGACSYNKGLAGFTPMNELDTKVNTNTFELDGALGKLLGKLERYRLAITLEGDQGSGKSQLTYQLADAFAGNGMKVGMFSLEMGAYSDLAIRMRDKYLSPSNSDRIMITDEIPDGINSIRKVANLLDVVIIDSWGKLDVDSKEFDKLRNDFPNTIWIVVFQRTGSGTIRGGTKPLYDAGINLVAVKSDKGFEHNYLHATKNRYGSTGIKYSIAGMNLIADESMFYN